MPELDDDDEQPRLEPFWQINDVTEARVVRDALKRRFPGTYAILTEGLESADPYEIVYPDNPNEYSDVVDEIIVLLAPVNGDISQLTRQQIDEIVRDGIAKCFGEEPDENRVRNAVRYIAENAGRILSN
jgi:hypothetical protein